MAIEQGRDVPEKRTLICVIVDRHYAWGGVLDPFVATEIPTGDEVLGLPTRTAVLKLGVRVSAAAVQADAAAIVEGAASRLDVDEPGGAQAELSRQGSSDQ